MRVCMSASSMQAVSHIRGRTDIRSVRLGCLYGTRIASQVATWKSVVLQKNSTPTAVKSRRGFHVAHCVCVFVYRPKALRWHEENYTHAYLLKRISPQRGPPDLSSHIQPLKSSRVFTHTKDIQAIG